MKRQRSVSDWSSTVFVLLALASAPDALQTEPYEYLDNVEGDIGFNPVPRRPMALSTDELHLYAVNTHASTVLHFTGGGSAADDVFRVPKSPVSITVWDDEDDTSHPEKLVVVCDGAYCLVVLDRDTGETLALMEMRGPGAGAPILGEPGDLLLDAEEKRAFVSCAAADAVLEVDLATMAPVRTFDLPAKDPVFMCFDRDMNVLVAPMLSGNSSGARQQPFDSSDPPTAFNVQHFGATVLDLATADQGSAGGLPDHDLFRCVRSTGDVEPVTRAMGTILFACGILPGTDPEDPEVIWQLNTEANNKDSTRQGEEAIRGDIVQNRLSVANLPAVGAGTPAPPSQTPFDLDKGNSGTYDDARSVGQPYALAFTAGSPYGTFAAIAGLLTDNLMFVDTTGASMVVEFDLDEGSIPRGLLYSPIENDLFVYCWGTSKVDRYSFTPGLPLDVQFDLGYDPASDDLKEGRRIYYDASNSEKNNASCASCHVEGRTDMLVWNLSKGPTDDKGPMVTQTLAGIEKLGPFHWRGEQAGLIDFNPAFVNLLGAESALSAGDFEDFERFVFSIQNRPNPFQNEAREVDDEIQPPLIEALLPTTWASALATNGQSQFVNGAGAACEGCHNFPLGTGGAITAAGSVFDEQKPHRLFLKVPPFHDLYKKEQDADKLDQYVQTAPITLESDPPGGADEDFEYPLLGAGFSHAGLIVNFHEFVSTTVFPSDLSLQERADISGFAYQWDQGVAPATYRGVLLEDRADSGEFTALSDRVTDLVDEAEARNCDVVAFGRSWISGASTPMRWYYFRDANLFVAERRNLTQPLSYFTGQADAGIGKNVFIGLPVGSGVRFGIDFDGDDLLNAEEVTELTDPYDPDSDGDDWPDGHEYANSGDPDDNGVVSDDDDPPSITRAVTQMVTARVARINVETDEPCTITIEYERTVSGAPTQTKSTTAFARTHSILLTDLLPSTGALGPTPLTSPHWNSYDGTVTAYDVAGLTDTEDIPDMPVYNQDLPDVPSGPPITTRTFVEFNKNHLKRSVIADLEWDTGWVTPGGIRVANLRVDQKIGGPAAVPQVGVRVVARLFVDGVLDTTFIEKGTSMRVEDDDFYVDPDGLGTDHASEVFTGIDGPYLVSAPTDSNGETTLGYKIPSLPSGADVQLNIEMVVTWHRDTILCLPESTSLFCTEFAVPAIDWYDKSSTPAANRALGD